MNTIEYRVRPVMRYSVTRYESNPETGSGSVETIGEYANGLYATRVMEALKRHDPLAEPLPENAPPSNPT